MCWATNTNQTRYLTFQMSKMLFPLFRRMLPILVLQLSSVKEKHWSKSLLFFSVSLTSLAMVKRCFIFRASNIKQFRLHASIFPIKILYNNRKKFCRFVITAISRYSEIIDFVFLYKHSAHTEQTLE